MQVTGQLKGASHERRRHRVGDAAQDRRRRDARGLHGDRRGQGDINGPALTREFAHQQSSGGYREYKPTFKNSGDVTFKCNFLPDDTTQGFATTGLLRDYEDGTLRNFELVFPDSGATKASFAAYVANIAPGAPIAGALELNVTLRVTGPVDWS